MNPDDQPVIPPTSDQENAVPPAPEQVAAPEASFPPQPVVSDTPPQPQAAPQPTMPPSGQPAQPVASNPGKGLGIAGFVVSLVSLLLNFVTFGIMSVVGLVLSIVGKVKSKKAGQPNGLALAGIIIGAVSSVLTVVFFALTMYLGVQGLAQARSLCQEKGAGVYVQGSSQITCGADGSVNVSSSKRY